MTSKRISALIMLALIFGVLLATIYNSSRNNSDFPKYNRFYYMKEYMGEIETFLKDNVPFRESLKNSAVKLEMLLGEQEFDGVFLGDDILIENIEQPDSQLMETNLQEIQQFVEMDCSTPVSVLYLPTKYAIKQQELPDYAELFGFNQKSFIEENYAALSGKATTVDAYSILLSNREQYLYYRSDPNLTGLGAYYVYSVLAQRLGCSPLEQEQFAQRHIRHHFYGETYAASPYKEISPDIITLYYPDNQSTVSVTHYNDYSYTYNTLYPEHLMELNGDLSILLGGDTGDLTISAGLKRSRSLLVLGDESILPVLPLLSAHYSTIRFLDFEKWNDTVLSQLDLDEFDQVLISYSVDSLIHEPYPAQLGRLRQQYEENALTVNKETVTAKTVA